MLNAKLKSIVNHALVGGLIFTFPSNLFYLVNANVGYVHGLRLDYLLPKLYLTDLLIWTILAWWWFSQQLKIPRFSLLNWLGKNRLLIIVSALLLFRQFFSQYPIAALWQVGKLFSLVVFFGALNLMWEKLKPNWLSLALILTIFFQATLGSLQFFNQQSIAGYWLLGEPNLINPIGLARQLLLGQERILAYGTTAHPNVLAGSVVILLLSAWFIRAQAKKVPLWHQLALYFATFLTLLTIYTTQSWTAFLVLVIALGGKWFYQKISNKVLMGIILVAWLIVPLTINYFSTSTANSSWQRRAYLNQAGLNMIYSQPMLGIGINNFVSRVEEFSLTREIVRFTQPAHHLPILIAAEVGLLGLVWLWLVAHHFSQAENWTRPILIWATLLIPIMTLDHYLWTLQTGWLLGGILLLTIKKFLSPHQR